MALGALCAKKVLRLHIYKKNGPLLAVNGEKFNCVQGQAKRQVLRLA